MMSTLTSLMTQAVFFMKTAGATSDDKVGIMATVGFQWQALGVYLFTSNYQTIADVSCIFMGTYGMSHDLCTQVCHI